MVLHALRKTLPTALRRRLKETHRNCPQINQQVSLNPDAEFVEYCAPCGDKPSKVQKVEDSNIEFAKMGADVYNGTGGKPAYREVNVNGRGQDLAYIYVRTGTRVFANVAMLTGCPVSGVPPFLYTAPGKTPSPVTIEDLENGRKPASETPAKKK